MNADPTTLIATTAGVVAVVCVVFSVTTLQRHHDRPNRLASASLLATFLGLVIAPAAGSLDDAAFSALSSTVSRTALVVSAVGLSGGAFLLWSATRSFAGREPMLGLVGGAAALAGGAAAIAGSEPRAALLPVALLAAAGWGLAAVEVRHSAMASNLNSMILQASLWACALGSIAAGALTLLDVVVLGDGWAIMAGVAAAAAVVSAMTLMALRVERYGNWWTLGEDLDRSELGIDERDTFLGQAHDRVERCRVAAQPVHVITTSLPGLDELNLAYGHLAGDAAMRWVAELLRRQAPPSAVLGHLGAGRFAIVTSREPELVANSIQNGMMRVAPPAALPVRLTPIFAWSSSDDVGFDFDLLRYTAEERMSHVS